MERISPPPVLYSGAVSRSPVLSLALGLALGFGLGLFLGWVVWPVRYVDTAPDTLRSDYKEDYVLMVAEAYGADDNLALAQKRLAALNLENPGAYVAELTDRYIADGRPLPDLRRLVGLALALGHTTPSMTPYLP